MILFSSIVFTVIAAVLVVATLVFSIECFLGMFAVRAPGCMSSGPRASMAVLIPAHNEESTIETAIMSVLRELAPDDRLVVIADNCTDATADIARKSGATVVERKDPDRQGKGYALNYGLRFLAKDPPQVAVIVDADCTLRPGAIATLGRQACNSGRPIQAQYLVMLPRGTVDHLAALSAFAFVVRTVRQRGLHRLGLPCSLAGAGMAIPWALVEKVPLDGESLVEDLQWGLELALKGHPPLYCPDATVTTWLPQRKTTAMNQRRRWEHGHLTTLIVQGPRLVACALQRGCLDLLAVVLDLCVPPLSLLVSLGTASMGGAILVARWGGWRMPIAMLAFSGLLVGVTVAAVWWRFGRAYVPAKILLLAPIYVFWKLPLYRDFVVRRQKAWVRTEREPDR